MDAQAHAQALFVTPVLNSWRLNGDYAASLLADLGEDQKIAQPAEGINHPAWLMSHLLAYHPVMLALAQARTPDDPLDHPFGMKSKPVDDASAYPPLAELGRTFAAGHREVEAALPSASADWLAGPPPIERWRPRFENVATLLNYLMVRHESLHLGQLSTWRRAMGLPRV